MTSSRTPEDIIGDFQRAFDLLTVLFQREGHPQGLHSDFKNLVIDARMRLGQAMFLLRRFRAQEQSARILIAHSVRVPDDAIAELRLHGEAFYYFAFRVREALRYLSRVDPACGLKFDAVGVRIVRNNMIEHPEDVKGHVLGWTVFGPEGLTLNLGDERRLDKGLYPNAQEFIEKLLQKLSVCPYLKDSQEG